jgi:phage shock protein A
MTKTEKTQLENLVKKVAELEEKINALTTKKGPASTREMTTEDAERIINGDCKDLSHKAAAEKLGLSYGQVYSARGGYTFKDVKKKK